MTFEIQIIARLALAAMLGAVIGIERELKHKPIGLRTNVLIAMAAAGVMLLGTTMTRAYGGEAVPRLAAAFLQGLGFLGAGTIIRERGSVKGLTTAAVLLAVAGIGLAAGSGAWLLAISATAFALLALTVFGLIERAMHTKCSTITYAVKATDTSQLIATVNRVVGGSNIHLHEVRVVDSGEARQVEFSVCNTDELDNQLVERVLQAGNPAPTVVSAD